MTEKQIQQCKYCDNRVFWDFKIRDQKKKDGTNYNGYWREVNQDNTDGLVHTYTRCQELQKNKGSVSQAKEQLQDVLPVGSGKAQTPEPKTPSPTAEKYSGAKPDNEILAILRVCGELEDNIFIVATEIVNKRFSDEKDLNKLGMIRNAICDRLTEIYCTRKSNERLDSLNKLLHEINGTLGGMLKA